MSSYPSFTLLSEVVTHLNASGPDSNGNYLVYGLTISSNSVQAFVDHANTYIGSLVPSVTSTDPALPVCPVSRKWRDAFGCGRFLCTAL